MRSASGRRRGRRRSLVSTLKAPGAVVLLCAVVGGGWYADQARLAALAREEQATAEQAAAALGGALKTQALKALAPFASLGEGADLAGAFTDPEAARQDAERGIQAAGKAQGLLRARLVPVDVDYADYSENPPLDYAALSLLRRSRAAGADQPAEMHNFGQPGQHIAIARTVVGADGSPAGHLLLQVDVKVLGKLGAELSPGQGYVALSQRGSRSLELFGAGNAAARQSPALLSLPVRGTAWRVQYWRPPLVESTEFQWPFTAAASGACVGFLLLAGVLNLRKRRRDATEVVPAHVEPMVSASSLESGIAERALTAEGAEEGAAEIPPDATTAPSQAEPAAVPGEAVSDSESDSMQIPKSIFRAYDVRGVYADTLTPAIVREIGRAIGSEAHDRGQNTVAVACDGRHTGPELKQALTEGLLAAGRDVIDVGSVPTPVLYFATYFLNTGSGVMVTGSHNPPEYNGLKIMLGGETLFGDDISGLRDRILSGNLVEGEGTAREMEILDEYVRRISEDIPVALGRSLKVIVDCGNGIAGVVAPKLMRALGHDVAELYCDVDGDFPNHHPDPSDPENLKDLAQAVTLAKADVGFAFDGDGDRLGVVDAEGTIIWPDRQMMLFSADVLRELPGAEIIFDVKCTSRLARVIEEQGGKPVMWKTGHSFMKNKLRESKAPLAGEMSGHIFFNDRWYGFDDAIYSAARLVEIMLNADQGSAELFATLPSGHSTPELKVEMAEGENLAFMERLAQAEGLEDGELSTIDGVRVDWPDGWGLVRASNTTPTLVLRFEGDTPESLARVQDRFRQVLLGLDESMSLPF